MALGQSEALGFSGSGASLTSAAPGFWPIAAGQVRTGRRDLSDDDWTDRSDNTCDLTRHLYCFEQ